MRIAFNNWRDAREVIEDLKVTGKPAYHGMLFLVQEDTYKDNPLGMWVGWTGRWVITDRITRERCALNWRMAHERP